MKIRNVMLSLAIIPSLLLAGCGKDDNNTNNDQIQYSEVSKTDALSYINGAKENNNLIINSYEFNMTAAMPRDFETLDSFESSENSLFPDVSDATKWDKAYTSGTIIDGETLEAKFEINEPEDITYSVYIKDNKVYMNTSEGKYMTSYEGTEELEYIEITSEMPSAEDLLEQLDMINSVESGLKFEKAEKDGKIYYHISGLAIIDEENEFGSFNMEIPIDLHLTFENDKLVSYKYKTMMLFVYMEFEVNLTTTPIEFPEDLDTYIENDDIFFEEFE